MSYSTILAKLKSEVEEVPDIGNVHDYERFQNQAGDVVTFKKTGLVVPEWTITRSRTFETTENTTVVERDHTFTIRGYYPIDDSLATEKTFQNLIEDLMGHFRFMDDLDLNVFLSDPLQLQIFEPRMHETFKAWVHYCELICKIKENVTG